VLCAAALGLHIALLSRYAAGYDASGLAFAQMLSMTLVFALFWPLFETVALPPRGVWIALIATGLVASAGAFWVQTFVQRRLSTARTAVILTMEPVFATLFGYWLAGDRLVAVQILGATMILSALAVSEAIPTIMGRSEAHEKKGDVSQ
jgi:drug/metabolite transporter (DMT)-like permease